MNKSIPFRDSSVSPFSLKSELYRGREPGSSDYVDHAKSKLSSLEVIDINIRGTEATAPPDPSSVKVETSRLQQQFPGECYGVLNRFFVYPSPAMDESTATPRLSRFAVDLEAELQNGADNLEAREHLIHYYYEQLIRSDAPWGGPFHDAWVRHVYWIIQHSPESQLAGTPQALVQPPCGTEEDYERGKQLWLSQTDLHGDDPAVLWNAAYYIQRNDGPTAQSLLEVAYSLKPGDPDIAKLLSSMYRRNRACGDRPEQIKRELARKALAMGEQSLNTSPIDRFYRLDDVAEVALEAAEFDKARAYSQELLDTAPNYESNWNYGNAIHNGNVILGRIALQSRNPQSAGEYLLKAGETRGSPQLGSFGPNMNLAKELLEIGQRSVVIRYFDLCAGFWESGQDRLRRWRVDVEQGRVPDFDN